MKKVLAVVAAITMVFADIPLQWLQSVEVYGADNEDFEISYDGTLNKYNGTNSYVIIPEGVTEICSRAFEGGYVESFASENGYNFVAVETTDEPTLTPAASQKPKKFVVWDGSVDIEWSGSGTKESPYLIYTPAELAGVVMTAEYFQGCYYKMMEDFDLGGRPLDASDAGGEWGGYNWGELYQKDFSGHFDGNDHTIKGFYCGSEGKGLFASITEFGSVEGLTIYGRSEGRGVICKTLMGTVTDCVSHVQVIGNYGGMISVMGGSATVEKCYNYGDMTVVNYGAGIVGVASCDSSENKKITNCANFGTITTKKASGSGYCAGGIVAGVEGNSLMYSSVCTVEYCENFGDINAFEGGCTGGIVGELSANAKIQYCANYGNVTSKSTYQGIGGVAGFCNQCTVGISDCLNKGNVRCSAQNIYVGGIMGFTSKEGIERCYAICKLYGDDSHTYGIGSGSVKNCYYVGNATGLGSADKQNSNIYTTKYSAVWSTYPEAGITKINGGFDYYEINELSELQNGFPVLNWEESRFGISHLRQTGVAENAVYLKWDIVSRATGYEIYRKDKENGEMQLVQRVGENTCTDTGLSLDTEYEYQIRSYRTENGHTYYGEFSDAIKVILIKGDVNGDGKADLTDAQIVLKAALRILSLSDEGLADVNEDSQLTLEDAQLVLKAALHIIDLKKI